MDPIAYADPADLSTADLGHQIAGLGGRINAATCRWLLLLAEFARREQWGDFPSCAAWLSWRCGIGPATAAEYVRVASALVHLPLVRARFAEGGLSYSQVRAVTRGVGYADEPELLSIADHATGAQLERIIRGLRAAITPREESARRERTGMTWFVDEEGFLVIRAKLDGEPAAIVHAALAAFSAPGADSTHSLVALAAAALATGPEPSNRGPSADPAGGPTGTVVSVIATIDALVEAVDGVPVDDLPRKIHPQGQSTLPPRLPPRLPHRPPRRPLRRCISPPPVHRHPCRCSPTSSATGRYASSRASPPAASSISADPDGRRVPLYVQRCCADTGPPAHIRIADPAGSSTCITSSIGRTGVRPARRIWCHYANVTTGACTRVSSPSHHVRTGEAPRVAAPHSHSATDGAIGSRLSPLPRSPRPIHATWSATLITGLLRESDAGWSTHRAAGRVRSTWTRSSTRL